MRSLKHWRRRWLPAASFGVLRVLSWLPLRANHALGTALGHLLYRLPNRSRRIVQANLAVCFPEMDAAQRRHLFRRTMVELGKLATETGPTLYWPRQRLLDLIQGVDNEALLDRVRQGGVLLLTPHFGNWEVAGAFIASLADTVVVYRPAKSARADQEFRRARERLGCDLAQATPQGVRTVFRRLRRGSNIGLLPDQEPKSGAGEFVDFFHRPALTQTLAARLAESAKAPVMLGFAKRLPAGKGYTIHIHELNLTAFDGDLREATAAMNRALETLIGLAPEQYLWAYKRFRTQPEGSPPVYP